jgi:hypothetical protein
MNIYRIIFFEVTTKKSYGFASLRFQNLTFSPKWGCLWHKSGLIPTIGTSTA